MVTGWGDPQPPVVVPVTVEFTGDEIETLARALDDLRFENRVDHP